jgi:predicted Zn-dependent peptidase
VKEKKIATNVVADPYYPGEKYPTLFSFYALPSVNHTAEEVEAALYEEIDRIKQKPVAEEELKKAKTRARADLIQGLKSDSGMAEGLAFYEVVTGDWRNLFRTIDKINAVTVEDVQRVARECFQKRNRVVGLLVTTK